MNHERENICDKTMNEITIQTKKRKLKNMKSYKYLTLICFQLLFSCSKSSDALFSLLEADETGINFNNFVEEDAENNVLNYGYFYNGGGVAAGDFNNDGYIDVFNAGTAYNGKKANLSFLIWNSVSLEFEEKNLLNTKIDFIGAPYKVTPVYLNDDNYVDLVIHGHADEGRENTNEPVSLCLSDGKGGYDLVKLELEPKYLSDMFTHESGDVADINNDGRPDLFVVANSHSYIFWGIASYPYFTNVNFAHFASDTKNYTSNNSFGESVSILNGSFSCRLLDLNKDGMRELFVAGQSENTILINKGNGRYVSNAAIKIPFPQNNMNIFDVAD